MKRWLGPAAYALVAAKALLRHRPFTCWVTVDGSKRTFEALELRIANGTHHGGIKVAEEASVESHDLVVYVIKGASRWKLARVWLNILLSRPLRGDDVEVVRTKRAHIETHPPQAVSVDGEVTTATPFVASVARQSLHLVVPIDRDDLH